MRIATPPMTHEMIAAGPAVARASCAVNSQPDPMIEPTDAHSRPMRPTSRRRCPVDLGPTERVDSATAMAVSLRTRRRRGRRRSGRESSSSHAVEMSPPPTTSAGRGCPSMWEPAWVSAVRWDGTPVLLTPRLVLRTFRRDDLPAYAALNADPRVYRYLDGVPMPAK